MNNGTCFSLSTDREIAAGVLTKMKDRVGYHGYYLTSPTVVATDRTVFNFERPLTGTVQLMEPVSFYGAPGMVPAPTISRDVGFADHFTGFPQNATVCHRLSTCQAETPRHVTADITWMSDAVMDEELVTQDSQMSANILIDLLKESLSDDCRQLDSHPGARVLEINQPMYQDIRVFRQETAIPYIGLSQNIVQPNEEIHRHAKLTEIEPTVGQVLSQPEVEARRRPEIAEHRQITNRQVSTQTKEEQRHRAKFPERRRATPRQLPTKNRKTHTCNVCTKVFGQQSSLRVHARVHTGERPFACTFCMSCFGDYSTFVKHVRVHTGEKPYKCDVCHKSFTQSGNMHRHRRSHHNKA